MSIVWLERMLMAEVSSGKVQCRPRLGWMDGVKVALSCRGMMLEVTHDARKIGRSGDPRCICIDD